MMKPLLKAYPWVFARKLPPYLAATVHPVPDYVPFLVLAFPFDGFEALQVVF